MPKNRDFAPLDPLPATWTDSLEEFASQLAVGLRIIAKPGTNGTVAQVVVPPGYEQVTVALQGKWRYIAGPIERAVPTGAARTLDAWLTASASEYEAGTTDDPGEIDLTDYTFALVLTESGVQPAGADLRRLVGRVAWDGARIAAVDMLVGEASGTARHVASHAIGGSDPLDPASIGARTASQVQTAVDAGVAGEATLRQQADAAEAQARSAADVVLADAITAEAQARSAADTALQGAITAEAQARASADANNPTADQKAALAGTSGAPSNTNRYVTNDDPRVGTPNEALLGTDGTPSGSNRYVTNSDPRNTNTRTPTDASVTLAKLAQALKASGSAAPGDEAVRKLGTGASDAMAGNSPRALVRREDRAFAIGGEIVSDYLTNGIPALPIEAWNGTDTVRLLGVQVALAAGTSVTFKIQRSASASNAKSDVPGLGTTAAPLSIAPGDFVKKIELGSGDVLQLADGERLWLTLVAVSGTPKDLSVVLVMTRTVS